MKVRRETVGRSGGVGRRAGAGAVVSPEGSGLGLGSGMVLQVLGQKQGLVVDEGQGRGLGRRKESVVVQGRRQGLELLGGRQGLVVLDDDVG